MTFNVDRCVDQREGAWQRSAVRAVLKILNIPPAALVASARDRLGDGARLSFWLLHGAYPDCPVRFGAGRLLYTRDPLVDFVARKGMTNHPLYRVLLDLRDDYPYDTRPVAVVFRLPTRGIWVLHDGCAVESNDVIRLTRTIHGRHVHVEPLRQFIRSLNWSPEVAWL